MIEKRFLLWFILLGVASCINNQKKVDLIQITKKYYEVLGESDTSEIKFLIKDTLTTRENEYNYEQSFSKKEYVEWMRWDSIFQPTYKIIEIEQEDNLVKVQISKTDKRISFLHKEPIVTNHIVRFDKDKITHIETVEYVVYNDSLFVQNRGYFLEWVNKNHPEMNGFIYDQTKTGGLKYLELIKLYERRDVF
jgi:hypothetical protein